MLVSRTSCMYATEASPRWWPKTSDGTRAVPFIVSRKSVCWFIHPRVRAVAIEISATKKISATDAETRSSGISQRARRFLLRRGAFGQPRQHPGADAGEAAERRDDVRQVEDQQRCEQHGERAERMHCVVDE